MLTALIDYGSGNLRSAAKALERAARENSLTAEIAVTSDPDLVRKADRVVLPGVGAFADCRRGLWWEQNDLANVLGLRHVAESLCSSMESKRGDGKRAECSGPKRRHE